MGMQRRSPEFHSTDTGSGRRTRRRHIARTHIIAIGFTRLWWVMLLVVALAACGAQELQVTVPNNTYAFDRTELTASLGAETTITLTNEDRRLHDLVIIREVFDDEEVAIETIETDPELIVGGTDLLRQGESETLTVTFDEPGTYQFFCRFPGHFRVGMRGTITVEG